jgi:2-dehydropantoate 2-reductase
MSGVAEKKIAVLGTGANGASIAADLTEAGLDVTLIEQWPAHVEKMRADGVRIEMPERILEVPVRVHHLCEVAELREPFDIVLVLMKAYDTRWACRLIEPLVAVDGVVAGVQNGMSADIVADVVGVERAVGCVIECSSMMEQPGVVERHSGPEATWFAVGPLAGRTGEHEREVAELLSYSGEVELVDDIRSTKWMKLVSNCTTLATTAVIGESIVSAVKHEAMRDLMVAAGQEAIEAGLAQGYEIRPIFGLGPEDVAEPGAVVDRLLDTLCAGFVLPVTTTTILHDWTKGRRSEVDQINGLVVAELGPERAPVNAAVVEIAHRIERGELNPGPDNFDLLAAGDRGRIR